LCCNKAILAYEFLRLVKCFSLQEIGLLEAFAYVFVLPNCPHKVLRCSLIFSKEIFLHTFPTLGDSFGNIIAAVSMKHPLVDVNVGEALSVKLASSFGCHGR
jgi:hypothetical protein